MSQASDYAIKSIENMSYINIISGYRNGKFGPEDNATRGQCAKMLWNIVKYVVDNSKDVSFIDR